jgi:NADPH:quinone reductase-like Zn-dependent oxidoreductase
MKAAVRRRYGGPDVVRIEEMPTPVPTTDQVLVRVHTASVNRADLDMIEPRPGFMRLFLGIRAPRHVRLGVDVAGTVEAVGPAVTRFATGDRVFGDLFSHQGSFGEYVAAPEKALQPIPEGIGFDVAATLPHSAILALQGLRARDGTAPGSGSRVLIDGASGNTGPFAIQLARHLGAEVTAIASADKLDFVRSLGADHVLDYASHDFTRAATRYDWILAADSHHPILAVRRALRPGGRYVTLGGGSLDIFGGMVIGPAASLAGSRKTGLMLWWRPFDPADVRTLTDLVLAGRLVPAIDRSYPLAEIADALRWVHEGHARGKVLVRILDT